METQYRDHTTVEPRQRAWARPCVRTVTAPSVGGVLLCTTNQPYVCEGGGCCDIAPDCHGLCNGG